MISNPKIPCYSLLRPLTHSLYHMHVNKNISHFDIHSALKNMCNILLYQK